MHKKYIIIVLPLLCLTQMTYLQQSETEESNQTEAAIDFDQAIYDGMRTFAQVADMVDRKHYKVANPQKAMEKSIDAFVSALDPHSSFLDPETYTAMMESISGEFFGIGIVIDNTRKPKDKSLTVVDIITDGPADLAGVQPYDSIVEIEGEALEGMTTDKATSKLKGERNTNVNIKIMREGQPDLLSFSITRDVIKEQHSLSFYLKNHGIYYLSLSMFSENVFKQIESLLQKSTENDKAYKGLILDLRNNSGGLLNAAVDISGLFLPNESLVVTTKNKDDVITGEYRTNREPIASKHLPIFILINNYTASAGEILAGCLQIHSEQTTDKNNLMVFLVGTKTFGKGSVQEVIPLGNNYAVKLTTMLYFLPNDRTVQGLGIIPDFTIERMLSQTEQMQWFTKHYGREETLENYIKVEQNESEKINTKEKTQDAKENNRQVKRWQERAKEMLTKDNQLREAITLINILHTAKQNEPELATDRALALHYLKQSHISSNILEIEEVKA